VCAERPVVVLALAVAGVAERGGGPGGFLETVLAAAVLHRPGQSAVPGRCLDQRDRRSAAAAPAGHHSRRCAGGGPRPRSNPAVVIAPLRSGAAGRGCPQCTHSSTSLPSTTIQLSSCWSRSAKKCPTQTHAEDFYLERQLLPGWSPGCSGPPPQARRTRCPGPHNSPAATNTLSCTACQHTSCSVTMVTKPA
jgi:hypothetical protein